MGNAKIGLILGYNHFFSDEPPKNRIDLIRSLSKKDLLVELAACNYRIKPPTSIFFDYNPNQNISEISIQLRSYPDLRDYSIRQYIFYLQNTSANSFIYQRAGLLYAINEINQSDVIHDIEGFRFSGYDQENIFKYLLLVNDEITQYGYDIFRVGSYTDLEKINLATLSLNEYMMPIDPLLIMFRAGSMFHFLENSEYKDSINRFVAENTGYEPHEYIYQAISMFFAKHMQDKNLNWYYKLNEGDSVLKFFEYLSTRRKFEDQKLEFLDIKKSPFMRVGKLQFVLLDNGFLLQMTSDLFVWSFLFDHVLSEITEPNKRKNEIKRFNGCIGQFYETYISEILLRALKPNGFTVKCFDDLKIKLNKQEIELSDIYIRKRNKIIVAELKTTRIVNKEKYASSIDNFYDQDREKFFKKHGLKQLANSVRNLIRYGKIIDKSFPQKRLKLFPVLVFGDILLSNPFFNKIFEDHFNELMLDINDPCVRIHPLTMMHISDWELIENSLSKNKINIFKLLNQHYNEYQNTMPFLYSSHSAKIKGYSTNVNEYYYELISKYSKK